MDWRWAVLIGVAAVAAAIRLRPRGASDAQAGDAAQQADQPPDAGREPAPRPSPREPATPAPQAPETGDDIADLDAALDRVWEEHAHDADALLDARLRLLVARKVPVRAIRRAPGGHVARVVFADGTVLLCRGRVQGDLGRLILATRAHSVRIIEFAHEDVGTRLQFQWVPGHGVAAVAVGLDQPD